MLNFFEAEILDTWFIYPLQLLNIFEVLYWLILASGLSLVLNETLNKGLGSVLSSYGTGLVLERKLLTILIITCVVLLAGFLLFKTINKIEAKKKISEKLQHLPELNLLSIDSTHFDNSELRPDQPSFLIYFNSECQFCQYGAKEIKKNLSKF